MRVAAELYSVLEANDFEGFGLLYVEEEHRSDANFVIASIMWHCVAKEKGRIILLKCHNSTQHYQHLLSKLGVVAYQGADEELSTITLDVLDYLEENDFGIQELLLRIREHCQQYDSITNYLIIDNFSYIFFLSSLSKSIHFARCCAQLLANFSNLKIVVCNHVSPVDQELNVISKLFYHLSDFVIGTISLKSGYSQDVSGHLQLTNNRKRKTKVTKYCYKIDDKKLTLSLLNS